MSLRRDLEDRHPAGGAALGDLEAEPALADPRLAHDSDQLPAPGQTRVDGALERAKLLVAADQRSQAARAGDLDWALFHLDPLQLEGLHLTHTLDLAHRRLPQPDVAPDERRGARGEADPSRSGRLLHSLGEADRVPDRRVGHVAALSDGPDDDLARVEPDPDRELEAVCALELFPKDGDVPLHLEGREAGAARMILVSDRSAEDRHDPVAREVVDVSLEVVDAVGEEPEEAVHDRAPVLGIDPPCELHRVDQIGEQDGDLLSLSLHPCPICANPVREVSGRICGLRSAPRLLRHAPTLSHPGTAN